MDLRQHSQDDETGDDEYPLIYIPPLRPSTHWNRRGKIRWVNLALWSVLILASLGALGAVWWAFE